MVLCMIAQLLCSADDLHTTVVQLLDIAYLSLDQLLFGCPHHIALRKIFFVHLIFMSNISMQKHLQNI